VTWNSSGRPVGRIQELEAQSGAAGCVVTAYLVGLYALVDRLAAWTLGRVVLGGVRWPSKRRRIPWDRLDLRDPGHLRLTCPVGELDASNASGDGTPDRRRAIG